MGREDRLVQHRLTWFRHAKEVSGSVAKTCRYYGISRNRYYRWYTRYRELGEAGLRDQSRRPHSSPRATPWEIADKVLYLRRYYLRAITPRLRVCPSSLIRTVSRGSEECQAVSRGDRLQEASHDNGGHAPLSGAAGALGILRYAITSLRPVMRQVKRSAMLHDRKGIAQELVHTGPERLHVRQWSFRTLDQSIKMCAYPGVMLQAREGGHIHDSAQTGPAAVRHGLSTRDCLPGFMVPRIGARQLDELPAVRVLVDGADMCHQSRNACPPKPRNRLQKARFLETGGEDGDLRGDTSHLRRQLIEASDDALDLAG